MDVRNCRSCGAMFQYNGYGPPMCANCRKKLDESFLKVRQYLKDNPDASINELAESAEVSIPQINQWIREERLIFSKNSSVQIPCESCGKMIRTGRYCKDCKDTMIHSLGGDKKGVVAEPQKPSGSSKARMRFLDH